MNTGASKALPAGFQPYPLYQHAFALLSGLIDPLFGVVVKLASIFWPRRLPAAADSPRRRRRGLTLVVGGIEGPSPYNHAMARGVLASGYRGSVVRFNWNDGIPFVRSLVNLTNRRHHNKQSDLLANHIRNHLRQYPHSPVCLVAQSGGCYIALRALEKLPPELSIHSAILIAASISPGFDLTAAVAKCRSALVSVRGPGDFFFLGIGTLIFGTSDRVFSPSAGWLGCRDHPKGFTELRWRPDWIRHGYLGNHTTSGAQRFISNVLVPEFISLRKSP